MATTTFCDITFTETVENYRFENKEYTFNEGDTVSLPRHTANKFVNNWNQATYAKAPYEVRDEDYDDIAARIRDKENSGEVCEVEKSDGEVCGREKPCPYHSEE